MGGNLVYFVRGMGGLSGVQISLYLYLPLGETFLGS